MITSILPKFATVLLTQRSMSSSIARSVKEIHLRSDGACKLLTFSPGNVGDRDSISHCSERANDLGADTRGAACNDSSGPSFHIASQAVALKKPEPALVKQGRLYKSL